MKDKGQDKIKKICDQLREETLEPAKQEAEEMLENAKKQAEEIVLEARQHAKKIVEDAKRGIEQERNVFHSSLTQASKQSIEALKQTIENKLFNDSIQNVIAKEMNNPKVIAELVNAIVKSIEKDGLSKEISVIIPQTASAAEVNSYLAKEVLEKLKNHSVDLGPFTGGAQVKLIDKKLTLDMSDKSLYEFLKHYVRKDFRKLIFSDASQ